MFFIGGAKLVLDFYGNNEVRINRAQLESLFKVVKRKENLSIAEVSDFDDPERCVVGLSLVAPSEKSARNQLDRVLKLIDASAFARVTMEDITIFAKD